MTKAHWNIYSSVLTCVSCSQSQPTGWTGSTFSLVPEGCEADQPSLQGVESPAALEEVRIRGHHAHKPCVEEIIIRSNLLISSLHNFHDEQNQPFLPLPEAQSLGKYNLLWKSLLLKNHTIGPPISGLPTVTTVTTGSPPWSQVGGSISPLSKDEHCIEPGNCCMQTQCAIPDLSPLLHQCCLSIKVIPEMSDIS